MHPIAINLGSFSIHWYGVLVALGFLLGLWNASRRAVRSGIHAERILDFGPWLIIGGIAGGRIIHVITYWNEDFADNPWWEIFMVHHGGLVFYGGLIGATLAGMVYIRWKKLPLWKTADILAPGLALGYFVGRFGCLMNGCCYGRECHLPWAVRYPAGHETHPVGFAATPVHPTQIYDSLFSLVLFLGLAWLYRRKKFDGQIFAAYLVGYAITRSIVEFFRGDYTAQHLHGGLTPAHLISIGILAAGGLLFWQLRRVGLRQN